jgi:hypothetical protein
MRNAFAMLLLLVFIAAAAPTDAVPTKVETVRARTPANVRVAFLDALPLWTRRARFEEWASARKLELRTESSKRVADQFRTDRYKGVIPPGDGPYALPCAADDVTFLRRNVWFVSIIVEVKQAGPGPKVGRGTGRLRASLPFFIPQHVRYRLLLFELFPLNRYLCLVPESINRRMPRR